MPTSPSDPILPRSTSSPLHPFTSALEDLDSPLWEEVAAACTSNQPPPDPPNGFPSNDTIYQFALPPILTHLDSLLTESGPLTHSQSALSHSLTQLSLIESSLDSVITSLEQHLSLFDATSYQLISLRPEATHALRESQQLTDFVSSIQIPHHVHTVICTEHPHSSAFASALQTLSDKLTFISLPQNSQAVACQHLRPTLLAIQAKALERVDGRLDQTFHLLRQPSSSFEILRNSLLCNQQHLIRFLSDHAHHPTHPLPTNYPVLKQYLAISRTAFRRQVITYTAVLSKWATAHPVSTQFPLDLVNIARGATGMFSAVFADTLAGSATNLAQRERSGLKLKPGSHTRILSSRREEVGLVLKRWTNAIGAMEEPFVTEADLMIGQGGEGPNVEELCRNVALFFADMVGKEISFLQTTFGQTDGSVVEDVVGESGGLLLRFVEARVAAARNHNEGLVGLMICLMLNRKFRCGIPNTEAKDARILFLLDVERVLQTSLLEEFDQEATRLTEDVITPVESVWNGANENLLLKFAKLAADILVVVGRGAEEVDAADIVVLIQKRLLSSMNVVVDAIDKLETRTTDLEKRLKARLQYAAAVSNVLDIPEDLVSPGAILARLREPVLEQLSRASVAYGKYVVDRHNAEIVRALSAYESRQHDVVRAELLLFRETLETKFRSIKDSYAFLTQHGNVSRSLHRGAEQSAFVELARWNEKISQLVREHMSSDLHLLVSRSAFVLAVESE